jgi:single-strand DNA-binding protein
MFNQVILIGRVGRDGELRQAGETHKLSFSLATTERYRGTDGTSKEKTTWHNLVMWGPRAEKLAPYIKSGQLLQITGRIDNRDYEKDGQKRYISEVVVLDLTFLAKAPEGKDDDNGRSSAPSSSGRSSGRATTKTKSGKTAKPAVHEEDDDQESVDDDIPF